MATSKNRMRPGHFLIKLGILLLAFAMAPVEDRRFLAAASSRLQSATATLRGTVTDESGAAVSDVEILATNISIASSRQVKSDSDGYFVIPQLGPGRYTITARRPGFAALEVKDVILNVNDQVRLTLRLKTGQIAESITVEGASLIHTESASVSTIIERESIENLPLNGRSFSTLIELTPGVVLTSPFQSGGQFSVNGQRANANYFMIDGVSANIGVTNSLGLTASGSTPGLSILGGTNNLVSIDALQEFRIQTSTYSPEFGRMPGAQVSIITRSGTNDFHGNIFEYFRNDALDANDWFANRGGLSKPPLRQNDFGGVLGGRIIRDRAFFFFSHESLRLRQPQASIRTVPSLTLRQVAAPQLQPFLNALPKPNGPDLEGGLALFSSSYSDPSSLDATSVRGDYLSSQRLSLFARYNHSPSESIRRNGLSTLNVTELGTKTLTAGATVVITSKVVSDFRANWSSSKSESYSWVDDFGGAMPPSDQDLFPSFANRENSFIAINAGPGAQIRVGRGVDNLQHQINLVDSLSITAGAHHLKLGFDYRRISRVFAPPVYGQRANFSPISRVLTGRASLVNVSAEMSPRHPLFTNFSAFAQDSWRLSPRLNLTYGLRWERNPPPTERGGNDAFATTGLDDPATLTLAPEGAPLYKTTNNLAPRFGLAYELSQHPGRQSVLRGGVGIFYDVGNGQAAEGYDRSSPFITQRFLFNVPFPLDGVSAAPPAFPSAPPFTDTSLFLTDPNLQLPYSVQWNIALEQSLGSRQTVSATYVVAIGRRLLRSEVLFNLNPNFPLVFATRNGATSDYHALQLQFTRRMWRGLQALTSYTWSHSIDTASAEIASNTPLVNTDPEQDRGSSSFDVRHSVIAAVSYDIPTPDAGLIARPVLGGWAVNAIFRSRTATPVDIISEGRLTDFVNARADLVAGVPLYIKDNGVAGGRLINRAAFTNPPIDENGNALRQGTLGRNIIRGLGVSQVDLAMRRELNFSERYMLQLRAEFFNLFNHPNFGAPATFLGDPLFGQPSMMLGRDLGGGSGFSPLYQIGGPRSIQLALKLHF